RQAPTSIRCSSPTSSAACARGPQAVQSPGSSPARRRTTSVEAQRPSSGPCSHPSIQPQMASQATATTTSATSSARTRVDDELTCSREESVPGTLSSLLPFDDDAEAPSRTGYDRRMPFPLRILAAWAVDAAALAVAAWIFGGISVGGSAGALILAALV